VVEAVPIAAGVGSLAHGVPHRRAQERERAAAEAAARTKRAEAERQATAEAQKIVAIWNARQAGGASPVVLSDDRRCPTPRSALGRNRSFACEQY
jgi:hypothetical protein